MALCADCVVLGRELAETYPPDRLKFLSARQICHHHRIVGAIERYVCRACEARWARELGPTAKHLYWTQCAVRQGNLAPELRVRKDQGNKRAMSRDGEMFTQRRGATA
jgi:hypothetical protein